MNFLSLGLLAALVTHCYSQQQVTQCEAGICYTVNVPEASAAKGNGDIFFQIKGPSSLQWIGLGQGSSMSGANIFMIYADSDANNVTLSPRLGAGNFQPRASSSSQAVLLSGSGISDGKMTANVRCSNCVSWDGGSMDLTSSNTNWIWAFKTGSAVKSDSVSADLAQVHDAQGNFNLDLTKARGGDSANPFAISDTTSTDSSNSTPSTPAGTSGDSSAGASAGAPGASSAGAEDYQKIAANFAKRNKAVVAHGIIMGLAFALLFPSGAIMIRLFSFKGLVWVHAGTQMLAYVLAIVGLGLGIYIAVWPSQINFIGTYHPVIGLLVVILLAFQPILGLIHHFLYKKHHVRTFWATAHVWFGRVILTLGIINGGLGLKLTGDNKKGEIAYGVIAGTLWLLWLAVIVTSYIQRSRSPSNRRVGETGEKLAGGYSPNVSSGGSPYNSYSLEERGAGVRR